MTPSCRTAALLPAALLILSGTALAAQATEGVDELFTRARRLAFQGKRAEALDLCRIALQRSPDYHDIRILVGRIHTWEGRYEAGRVEFQRVLAADPGHLDGRIALTDLELWSDHPAAALTLCDQGLALKPGQAPLLLRKARAQKALGAYSAALQTARQALAAEPDLYEARQLIENLAELSQRSKVSLTHTYDRFDRTFDPWHLTALSLSHRFDAGSLIGRDAHAQLAVAFSSYWLNRLNLLNEDSSLS